MKKPRIVDKEYKEYVEQLPCMLCGHVPVGERSIYNEYADKYVHKPCRNTAHHVDTERTRAGNDHRIVPVCGHYTVSGRGTANCHLSVHGNKEYKTKESKEEFVEKADQYYLAYCVLKDTNPEDT